MTSSNVYKRAWTLILIFFLGTVPLGFAAMYVDGRFAPIMTLYVLAIAMVAWLTIRCPNCGRLATSSKVGLFGRLPRKRCAKCGADLTGSD